MAKELMEVESREKALLLAFRRLKKIQQLTVENICKYCAGDNKSEAMTERPGLRLVVDSKQAE